MTTKPENPVGRASGQYPRLSQKTLSLASEIWSAQPTIESTPPEAIERRAKLPKMVMLTCYRCGKTYERARKEHERSMRRYGKRNAVRTYCSKTCFHVKNPEDTCECGREKAPAARVCKVCYLAQNNTKLTCTMCGTVFSRSNSEIRKAADRDASTNAFCSRGCYEEHRVTRVPPPAPSTGSCKTCGKPVYGVKKYCSMTCYSQRVSRAAAYTGDWSASRKKVNKRDQGVCGYCEKPRKHTQVHHIDHDATNHEMENLILLCDPCHSHYHQRTSASAQAILRAYFQEKVAGS